MSVRDKMRDGSEPFLQPDEQIQEVAFAQSTAGVFLVPLLMIAGIAAMVVADDSDIEPIIGAFIVILGGAMLTMVFVVRYRVLCWTDRSLLLLEASPWSVRPTGLLKRLPRETPVGPVRGIWSRVQVADESLFIHRRFRGDVASAAFGAVPRPNPPT